MDTKCCEMVRDSTGWHSYNCARKPFIEVDSKTYCAIHNPAKVKERQEKSDQKYHANDCKNCTHHFQSWELKVYSYCPMCGNKISRSNQEA